MRAIPLFIAILVICVGLYIGLRSDEETADTANGDAPGDLIVKPDANTGGREVLPDPPPMPAREAGGESKPMTVDEYIEKVKREEGTPPAAPQPVPEPEKPTVEKPGPMELLKQAKVTLELDDESALVVLASIAAEAGVTLDMPKDLQDTLGKAPVAISLAEVSGENALQLVLMLAAPDLTYGEKDGKIVIHRRK